MRKIILLTTLMVLILLSACKTLFRKKEPLYQYIQIGKIIYPGNDNEIEKCFHLFSKNVDEFEKTYPELIEEFHFGFESEEASLDELLYNYGEWKSKTIYIEKQNEGEIEALIQWVLNEKIEFKETLKLNGESSEEYKDSDEFTSELFASLNKDLKNNGYTLMLFARIINDGWNLIVVKTKDVDKIISINASILTEL